MIVYFRHLIVLSLLHTVGAAANAQPFSQASAEPGDDDYWAAEFQGRMNWWSLSPLRVHEVPATPTHTRRPAANALKC